MGSALRPAIVALTLTARGKEVDRCRLFHPSHASHS